MANLKIPYLTIRPGAKGERYYWQPSSRLRAEGWGPVDYQSPVETPDGPRLLDTEAAIIAHARARNRALAAWREGRGAEPPARAADPLTLAAWIARFLDSPAYRATGPDAQRQYRTNLRILGDWAGDRRPGAIGRADVETLHADLAEGRGLRTAGAVVTSLARLYNWAEKEHLSKGLPNPASGHRFAKPRPRAVRWEDDEIAALVALADAGAPEAGLAPDPAFGDAVAIAYYLAPRQKDVLRLGEADRCTVRATLDRQRIERPGVALVSSKTGQPTQVPIHKALLARLEARPRTAIGPWVVTREGQPYQARWFRRQMELWRGALAGRNHPQVAGKTFHDLRRSAVCKLGELGMTDEVIASISGHSYETVKTILETYLVRSSALAARGIIEWEMRG